MASWEEVFFEDEELPEVEQVPAELDNNECLKEWGIEDDEDDEFPLTPIKEQGEEVQPEQEEPQDDGARDKSAGEGATPEFVPPESESYADDNSEDDLQGYDTEAKMESSDASTRSSSTSSFRRRAPKHPRFVCPPNHVPLESGSRTFIDAVNMNTRGDCSFCAKPEFSDKVSICFLGRDKFF